jgi:hypothetical protein
MQGLFEGWHDAGPCGKGLCMHAQAGGAPRLTLLPPVKVMGGAGCVKCCTTVATTCLPDHRGLGFRMAGACSLMFTSWGLPAAGGGVSAVIGTRQGGSSRALLLGAQRLPVAGQ